MGKLLKGIVKFSVAAATVGGVCYVFKDKIKQSKFYQEYDVDSKIDKVKSTIKEKIPAFDDEADIVEEDELFFDDSEADGSRDYVSLNSDSDDETDVAASSDEEVEDDAVNESGDESNPEVPTINL